MDPNDQQVKVRQLRSRFDRKSAKEIRKRNIAQNREDGVRDPRRGTEPLATEVPRLVTELDSVMRLGDARVLVRSGELAITDLVNDGAGWATIADHPLFGDDVAAAPAPSPLADLDLGVLTEYVWPVLVMILIALMWWRFF